MLTIVLMTLAAPASAVAHAVVEETSPPRGAALERAPERVELAFDEPVESSFGALRVFGADGGRVDVGDIERPAGDAIAVGLEDGLPDGAYTVTYRVVSADSHPVTGGYVFTVGQAGGRPAAAVSDLLDEGAGPVTDVAFGAARAASYAAIALLAGGLVFLLAVWLPGLRQVAGRPPETASGEDERHATAAPDGWTAAATAFRTRATALLAGAALAGLAATALGIVLQAATATGGSFWSALDSGPIDDVLSTRFGDVWKLRFMAFGVLAALLLLMPPDTGRRWTGPGDGSARGPAGRTAWLAAFAAACLYLVASPALGGHAGAADDKALLAPLDVVHVAAMSCWVGGVALLLLAVPAATRRLDPGDRRRLLATLVGRFSRVALGAVAALVASGVVQSILYLDSLSDLFDTAFGRAIVVKVALLGALVALGASSTVLGRGGRWIPAPLGNRSAGIHRPPLLEPGWWRGPGAELRGCAGVALRRTLRAEVTLMAAVLAVTAALVAYSPSADSATGPFSDSADLGPARIELTVDPARAGRNAIHVYLFDRRTGAQYDRPRRLGMSASDRARDIGPIALDVRKAGPGHYTVARADLAPAGDWTLRVRAPVSDFEELRTELEVPIR